MEDIRRRTIPKTVDSRRRTRGARRPAGAAIAPSTHGYFNLVLTFLARLQLKISKRGLVIFPQLKVYTSCGRGHATMCYCFELRVAELWMTPLFAMRTAAATARRFLCTYIRPCFKSTVGAWDDGTRNRSMNSPEYPLGRRGSSSGALQLTLLLQLKASPCQKFEADETSCTGSIVAFVKHSESG